MGTGGALIVIDFSEPGNSAWFRTEGWSGQEHDRVWAVGPRAVLRVPIQPSDRSLMLEAEIAPARALPEITGQLVRVLINGETIGATRIERRSLIRCEIDPALISVDGTQEIEFEFSGFVRAALLRGGDDERPLSAWFSFVRLYTTDMFRPGPWFPASQPDIPVIGLTPPADAPESPGQDVAYTFGLNGSVVPYLREGWDGGEADFTWTVAPSSRLALPAPRFAAALRFDVIPFIVPGVLPRQHVTVTLSGIVIGQVVMREPASWILPLPAELVAGRDVLDLNFLLPGARRCSDFGPSPDHRLLGVALTRIGIVPRRSYASVCDFVREEQAGPVQPIDVSARFLTEDAAAIEAALGMSTVELARGFESLGISPVFGTVQRILGVDRLNLFRFADATPLELIRALTDDLIALSDPDAITVEPAGDDHVKLSVPRYNLRWRIPIATRTDPVPARDHVTALEYLRRKFYEGLCLGHRIYVLHARDAVPIAQAAALLLELGRHGEATVLCVEPAPKGRHSGEVDLLAPGLLLGYLDRFVPDTEMREADAAAWLPVLANAALLQRGSA